MMITKKNRKKKSSNQLDASPCLVASRHFSLSLSLSFPFTCSRRHYLPGFTGFYPILPDFTTFNWDLLGFTGFYRVLPGFTVFYLVLPGFGDSRFADAAGQRSGPRKEEEEEEEEEERKKRQNKTTMRDRRQNERKQGTREGPTERNGPRSEQSKRKTKVGVSRGGGRDRIQQNETPADEWDAEIFLQFFNGALVGDRTRRRRPEEATV